MLSNRNSLRSQDSKNSIMDKKITISLVVPVYGVEMYIAEFARSVFSQSYSHVQYIFVDDGTKDRSIEVLKDVIDNEYPNLKDNIVIVSKDNAGLPAARKTGLEYVTGDYVYHVDPDDWLSPGSLEAIAEKALQTDADIIYFNYVKEYENRSSVKKEREYAAGQKAEYVRNMYNHKSYGTLCNKCIKTELYRHHVLYHPTYSYAEDCFLSVQLVGRATSLAYLDMDIYHYRKNNPHSLTRQNRIRRKCEYAMNFLDLYERYKEVPEDENPVSVIFDDILIQAGWYSIAYGLNLFEKYPYLSKAVARSRIRTGSDVWIPCQIITKLISCFK